VTLTSGAFLLVEQTALGWTIDVNSGSNIGSQTIEKSAWEINSEALEPLAQLISLREMSGTIVVDFLHMDVIPKWNELKKNFLKLLKAEHTGVHVECVPSMGIVLISRRRERPDIVTRNMKNCTACQGSGLQLKAKAMLSQLYQRSEHLAHQGVSTVVFKMHPDTLKEIEKNIITLAKSIKEKLNVSIEIEPLLQGRLDEIDFYIKKSSTS
jgi:Ribonuclease G/E